MKVICYKMTSEAFKAREIKIKNVLNTGTNKHTDNKTERYVHIQSLLATEKYQ